MPLKPTETIVEKVSQIPMRAPPSLTAAFIAKFLEGYALEFLAENRPHNRGFGSREIIANAGQQLLDMATRYRVLSEKLEETEKM